MKMIDTNYDELRKEIVCRKITPHNVWAIRMTEKVIDYAEKNKVKVSDVDLSVDHKGNIIFEIGEDVNV